MKKRIWELDAFRGLCLLGMVAIHLIYDLSHLYGIIQWQSPAWFSFVQDWGGVLFIILSGICVTPGRHHVKRGLIVVGCGLVVTAVTLGMYLLDFSGKEIMIYFGVLHCLGVCMLLWPVFRKLSDPLLTVLGIVMIAAGLYLDRYVLVDFPWLLPLGFFSPYFPCADYFPLLPHLGFFLLGAVIGRRLYAKKESLLPQINEQNWVIRFLSFCGRQSLWIYMGHQPILAGLCMLIAAMK